MHDLQKDSRERFVFGKSGQTKLIVSGINPSTANQDEADQTITRVSEFTRCRGIEGFVMLNLYAQGATSPTDLHLTRDTKLVKCNLRAIRYQVRGMRQPRVWAAWGNLIGGRTYLWDCLSEILDKLSPFNPIWEYCGAPTKLGHPRHPSRLAYGENFSEFSVSEYLQVKRIVTK